MGGMWFWSEVLRTSNQEVGGSMPGYGTFSGMGPDPVHTMDLRMDFTTICTKILPVGTRRLLGDYTRPGGV